MQPIPCKGSIPSIYLHNVLKFLLGCVYSLLLNYTMMKNFTLILLVISAASFSSKAQIFTDNFDSYTVGQGLVAQNPTDWDTWTPSTPGEDVLVSDANSNSGNNSLYFSSVGGGPEDIILRFDQVYNSGNFTLEANFYVESGKGAYFNLQETFVVGGVWAIDCFMLDDGTLKLSNSSTPYLTTVYPTGQWFNLRLEIDLTANVWELFLDNVSQGSFSNPTGSIGILDLYPTNPTSEGGNNQSGFYVDDVSYDHIPASLPPVNGGVTFVNAISGILGQSLDVSGTVRNLGSDPITSFDIEYEYNGVPVTESVGPISLASLATYDHTFSTPVTLVAGANPLSITISNVNGAGPDADASDDMKTITVDDPVVPGAGKLVIGEEGTGTWCGWCPRGAVAMEEMATKYDGFWQGIAVHNADPMAVADYDAGLGALISGYPSAIVDRGADIDPSAMEIDFLQRIVIDPRATMSTGANYNATTGVLDVSLTVDWASSATGSYKIACVLVEDGVTGTGSGYAQSNYYSFSSNDIPLVGAGLDWQAAANPVPASLMVYDHVARAICPSFDGHAGFPGSISASDQHVFNFEFEVDAAWDDTKMHIVGLLIDPSGRIDNGSTSSIADAVTAGFTAGDIVSCGAPTVINGVSSIRTLEIFPNPARTNVTVKIGLEESNNVIVDVFDISGKIVASQAYDQLEGTHFLDMDISGFASGMYTVNVQAGEFITTRSLIVE